MSNLFYYQGISIYGASLYNELNWFQYLVEGQKSRPSLCIVLRRTRRAWLVLEVFSTSTGNYVVSVLHPSCCSFFSLNWLMINHYYPGIWSIQVYLVVWFVMVIDRFSEGECSTFLFFLWKDWLFNHFTGHLLCSST